MQHAPDRVPAFGVATPLALPKPHPHAVYAASGSLPARQPNRAHTTSNTRLPKSLFTGHSLPSRDVTGNDAVSMPHHDGPCSRRAERRKRASPAASMTAPQHDPLNGNGMRRPNGSLASLHEVTERIADLLHVGSLHDHSTHDLVCPKDAPVRVSSDATERRQVVVVFGKRLVGDKFTVEFAKRVTTLVKQIATGQLTPDTICFAGGRSGSGPLEKGHLAEDGAVSEASAGYLFFRSLCDEVGVDASQFEYIVEEQSTNTRENIDNVLKEVRARYGADSLATSHFTLVSSDYHLIRIQEVHRISPRRSFLFALEVASGTWNCIFAAYPFCVSQDPTTAFLGRAMILANDLSIVLVNLASVVDDRQFLARENIARLSETFAKMRDMFRVVDRTAAAPVSVGSGFRSDLRSYSETLELAIHRVREAHTLLVPLADPYKSVAREELELAHALLSDAVRDMRESLDPDRPLRIADQIDILDDLSTYVERQSLQRKSSSNGAARDRAAANGFAAHRSYQGGSQGDRAGELAARRSRAKPRAKSHNRIGRDGPNVVVNVIMDDAVAANAGETGVDHPHVNGENSGLYDQAGINGDLASSHNASYTRVNGEAGRGHDLARKNGWNGSEHTHSAPSAGHLNGHSEKNGAHASEEPSAAPMRRSSSRASSPLMVESVDRPLESLSVASSHHADTPNGAQNGYYAQHATERKNGTLLPKNGETYSSGTDDVNGCHGDHSAVTRNGSGAPMKRVQGVNGSECEANHNGSTGVNGMNDVNGVSTQRRRRRSPAAAGSTAVSANGSTPLKGTASSRRKTASKRTTPKTTTKIQRSAPKASA